MSTNRLARYSMFRQTSSARRIIRPRPIFLLLPLSPALSQAHWQQQLYHLAWQQARAAASAAFQLGDDLFAA